MPPTTVRCALVSRIASGGTPIVQVTSKVLDAIAMAGGFTDLARPNHVVVLRNTASGQQRIKIDIKQVVADDRSRPFYLEPLDTVYVEGR